MRRYETIFILDPDLTEDGRGPVFDRVRDLVPAQGGVLLEFDPWGSRRMAYEIKRRNRGFYTRLDYCGPSGLVDEMERFFRIDDRVLKYLTVMVDEHPDPEKLQAEMAEKKERAQAQSSPEATPTPSATAEPEPPSGDTENASEPSDSEEE